MHTDPVFYPLYYELAVALFYIMVAGTLLWVLFLIINLTNEYNRLKKMSVLDLYVEMTRCVSAIMVCASRDNSQGAHFASRKVWLISLALQKGEYTEMERALAESYFENYLALFRAVDRGGDVVAYNKEWRDRWSRKPISGEVVRRGKHERNDFKEVRIA